MSKTISDVSMVEELAKLLNKHDLSEIEYENEGLKLRIARGGKMPPLPPVMPMPQAPAAQPVPAAPSEKVKTAAAPAGEEIKSPMVGVVYASPEPNAKPYVSVGDTVSADQTLFLIEAMKTFNPVKAPRAGKVLSIAVADHQPVEYGEVLLILE